MFWKCFEKREHFSVHSGKYHKDGLFIQENNTFLTRRVKHFFNSCSCYAFKCSK